MRYINAIIVHCSANTADTKITTEDIRRMHIEQNHWADIGYHFVIERDGTIRKGRPLSKPGAHCRGHNAHSIGICYIGGIDQAQRPEDNRTAEQRQSLLVLITNLIKLYRCSVYGHHDFNKYKSCPSFDAAAEYRNIYHQICGL